MEDNRTLFIAWSKPKSQQIAKVIFNFLNEHFNTLSPFFSSKSIPKGKKLFNEIEEGLQNSYKAFFIITDENTKAEWPHFELGFLSGKQGVDCVPILFGINDEELSDIFKQRYYFKFEKEKFKDLIIETSKEINKNISSAEETNLGNVFDDRWQQLNETIVEIINRQSSYNIQLIKHIAKVKEKFEIWQNRFIHLNAKEKFDEILLFAKETDWDAKEIDESEKIYREGSIEFLREKLISDGQNQMVIVGDAGMGKTTTMRYLALKDAKRDSFFIPIYIELKLISSEIEIEDFIVLKYDFVKSEIINILKDGNASLLLDGLNEVSTMIKQSVYLKIKNLITKYPKTFILLSSRKHDYNSNYLNIPVFEIQRMGSSQIKEFLEKNAETQDVKEIILNVLLKNNKWEKVLGTPLLLFMLIKVVVIEKAIPNDENKIILKFIQNLYRWEKEKDIGFDHDYFDNVLAFFAYRSIILKGNTNAGMTISEIEKIIKEKDSSMGFKDLLYFVKKSSELNILVEDNKMYSFAHQTYQETLGGYYFNTIYR